MHVAQLLRDGLGEGQFDVDLSLFDMQNFGAQRGHQALCGEARLDALSHGSCAVSLGF
ncbi:hypothetical protein SDC9_190075 [bioreactor metagenome]|uniref:Uncharacterized protein n=1 Tax=bioreactor metagenome TaxID=1076179 RepID=A0A645HU05_9ZZZZ